MGERFDRCTASNGEYFEATGVYTCKNTLAGVAQWVACQPANPRVTDSNPGQGTSLGGRTGPQSGVHERQPPIDVSLPLFLPSLFLKVISEIFKKKYRIFYK